MQKELEKIPYLGLGIGLRFEILKETLEHSDSIDCVEIIAEEFFQSIARQRTLRVLEAAAEHFHVIPHGIKLSIGSSTPVDEEFIGEMKHLTEFLKISYYSDHFTLAHNRDLLDTGHLTPLWYTREMLEHVVEQVDRIQNKLGLPLVLENITAPFVLENADFEEPEFIAEVCRRTGCGLLLDVTNIHINAYNRSEDALKLLRQYPMNAVVQVHLAGGKVLDGYFHDTHSEELDGPNDGVWELFAWAASHAPIKAVVIERDSNFKSDFQTMLLNDLTRARSIIDSVKKTGNGSIVTGDLSKQRNNTFDVAIPVHQ